MKSAKTRNIEIQYLRGYAAAFVVADHAMLRVAKSNSDYEGLAKFAGDLGAMGVFIFFVISGFIMVSTARNAFATAGATRRFWISRFIRIAPMYWLATTIAATLSLLTVLPRYNLGCTVNSLFFLACDGRPDESSLVPVHSVGWTLNYEMLFYFLFGIGLFFRKATGLAFVTGVLLVLVVLGQALPRLEVTHALSLTEKSAIVFYTQEIMLLFAAGMALAALIERYAFQVGFIPAPASLAAMLAVAVLLLLNTTMPGQYPMWRTLLLYGIATTAVALCTFTAPSQENIRLLEYLGDASYSVYLFHGFALSATIALWHMAFGQSMPVTQILITAPVALLFGCCVYSLVERQLAAALQRNKRPEYVGTRIAAQQREPEPATALNP